MTDPAHPDLTWHLRRLLEAVTDACGRGGRWGWLTAPVGLLLWFRTRREQQEAAAMIEAFRGMANALLGLLEDFRAGKLVAPTETAEGEDFAVGCPSLPSGGVGERPPAGARRGRTVNTEARGSSPCPEVNADVVIHSAETAESVVAGTRWIPAPGSSPRACFHVAGMTGTFVEMTGMPPGLPLRAVAARGPPAGFFKNRTARRGICVRTLLRLRNVSSSTAAPAAPDCASALRRRRSSARTRRWGVCG